MKWDRVVCVSLERRPDRELAFRERVAGGMPFGPVEIMSAVDGQRCKHPGWWKMGGGAWGCYRSHMRILEDALMDGHESVLVFEDDVTFADDFDERYERFMSAVPDDWEQIYLGGQHLKRPREIYDEYVRCLDVNRTHAYGVRGEGIKKLYRWLNNTKDWKEKHHVDHHYGRIHSDRGVNVYAPVEWMCGQAHDHRSDVCCKEVQERWWMMRKPEEPVVDSRLFVAVIGLHRSGSSATAMMLHKLGVSMGDKLGGYEGRNGGGGEAVGLTWLLEACAKFPRTEWTAKPQAEHRLDEWIKGRWRRAGGGVIGGKYPHLCGFGAQLQRSCGNKLRVIHCDRPLEDSIESLIRRAKKSHPWLSDAKARAVQEWLWEEKAKTLANIPPSQVLDVQFDRILSDTEAVVDEMIAFLEITPSPEQRQAAIDHVRENRRQ